MVVNFHDETTFNANECQKTQLVRKGEYMIMPKSKGSGIMVSDIIDRNGYLKLDNEKCSKAKEEDPTIKQNARVRMEYGESPEGYWNFMKQREDVSKIAEVK